MLPCCFLSEHKARSLLPTDINSDDAEEEFGPGDVGYVPPGHNALYNDVDCVYSRH